MTQPASVAQCAAWVNSEFKGNGDHVIDAVADLDQASPNHLSFIVNKKYLNVLQKSRAGVVIIPPEYAEHWQGNAIIATNPKLAYAIIAKKLYDKPVQPSGIHPTAIIDTTAQIGSDVSIGAHVVIEAGCRIGAGVSIGANSAIGENVTIGDNTRLHPRVSIYTGTVLGKHCLIHSGAVIGCEGFGYVPHPNGWEKVPQLGIVEIGHYVEIGANTTIDRGTLGNTIIKDHVILDNLIQIGHNVHIGAHTALAANVGVAGSTKIGSQCMIGGGCNINGHIEICDGVQLVGASSVGRSIRKPGAYGSSTMVSDIHTWKKNAFRFGYLDKMAQTVSKLQNRIAELEEREA
jgi:UDP-3-O-[3-hydroxymyristoyl] glucosamine N-acyltransferase